MKQARWISMPELSESIIRVTPILSLDHRHNQTTAVKQDRSDDCARARIRDNGRRGSQGMIGERKKLARHGTRRTRLLKRKSLFSQRYATSNLNILTLSLFRNHNTVMRAVFENNSGGRSQRCCAAASSSTSSCQTPPNTDTVRAKATVIFELSLFRKFGGVTAPEFEREAMVSGDPEGCQEIESNLHVETSSDSPMTASRRQQHDDRLPARP
ncbi:hypothetical protein Acr_27g0005510 [Actinidia rufa]|uniref:Uncharacterized protein n=1 Tax=Actinidia rufa TaxID=165716 RepID=A0A7J0H6U4_9ERIC|nr:hypothetical protein Acr_27g0005510 [Actinidia rufa]